MRTARMIEAGILTPANLRYQKWWETSSIARSKRVAVYVAKDARNLADSLVNQINPGTYDLTTTSSPTWDRANGWKFDGTQFLKTGIAPAAGWSMLVRFSNAYTYQIDQIGLAGSDFTAAPGFCLYVNYSNSSKSHAFGYGNSAITPTGSLKDGVMGLAATNGYLNGTTKTAIGGSWSGTPKEIFVGALNNGAGSPVKPYTGHIQAVSIFNATLTDAEMEEETNALNAIGTYPGGEQGLRYSYMRNGFGAIIHWGMQTFIQAPGMIAPPNTDVNNFAPTGLDIDQWLTTIKAAGGKYAVYTSKHHDGFAMWPTTYHVGANPPYSIAQTDWYANNGNPDVIGLFITKCRQHGISPVLYFSIWDLTFEAQTGTTAATNAAGYIEMIEAQLTELLTNYGPLDGIWLDGWGWNNALGGYTYITPLPMYDFIKALQPNCLVLENSDLFPPIISQIDIAEGQPIYAGNLRYAEQCQTSRYDGEWFFVDSKDQTAEAFITPTQIKTFVTNSMARNGSYLLGVMPDKAGVIPPVQVTMLESVPTAPVNLIANGGFEELWVGWTQNPGDGTIARDTVKRHSGRYSLKITRGTNPQNVQQYATVTPGVTYTLTFWAAGDGTAGRYGVNNQINSTAIIGTTTTGVTSATFTKVSVNFTAPVGCTVIGLVLSNSPTNGAVTYYDDVQIIPNVG
jgi:alpha-L-fucosidase